MVTYGMYVIQSSLKQIDFLSMFQGQAYISQIILFRDIRSILQPLCSPGCETQFSELLQWRSHWGGKGGRVPPLTAKICQNLKKIRKKEEKLERKGKNREVSFILPLLTDRAGYATELLVCVVGGSTGSQVLLNC